MRIIALTAGCLLPSACCLADAIWLDAGETPLFANARITRVEKGQIFFLINGNETSRELAKIARIAVDDEPALTAAETAFAGEKWDAAVDGYEKVVRSSGKPWVRDWASSRLIEAAGKSGRFDSAVTAWLVLAQKDPAAAARSKPALPDGKSTYLDTAVQQLEKVLASRGTTDEQRSVMLAFLLDVQTARGDTAAANAAAERLDEILAKDPNNPAAARANVRRKLQSAAAAIDAGKFDDAEKAIEMSRAIFVEPVDQAEALFLLAEARAGRAGDDKTKLQDAAIAFMRVVALGKELPGRPRVAVSLLKTAEICVKLGDESTARRLVEEVKRDYPDNVPAPSSRGAANSAAKSGN